MKPTAFCLCAFALSVAFLSDSSAAEPLVNDALPGCAAIRAAVAEDLQHAIRPGGVAQPGFWTRNSVRFMYPPTLEFLSVTGAHHYAFTVTGAKRDLTLRMKSEKPVLRFTSADWEKLPVGNVNVVCEPRTSSDRATGIVQDRFFWKKQPFTGDCPPAATDYATAARRAYAYLIGTSCLRHFAEKGVPDPDYELNCYPSKMHPAVIGAMLHYAKLEPSRADEALALARKVADYLLSLAEPEDAALPGFTPTYAGDKLAAKLIRTYLALYRAEGRPLDLAKARALEELLEFRSFPNEVR